VKRSMQDVGMTESCKCLFLFSLLMKFLFLGTPKTCDACNDLE
jgi:hypothetical protein